METSEELLKELRKWLVEYVKAHEDSGKLLPSWANLSEGEQITEFLPTNESLAKYGEAVERMDNALARMQEIRAKLGELSNL